MLKGVPAHVRHLGKTTQLSGVDCKSFWDSRLRPIPMEAPGTLSVARTRSNMYD